MYPNQDQNSSPNTNLSAWEPLFKWIVATACYHEVQLGWGLWATWIVIMGLIVLETEVPSNQPCFFKKHMPIFWHQLSIPEDGCCMCYLATSVRITNFQQEVTIIFTFRLAANTFMISSSALFSSSIEMHGEKRGEGQ